MDKNKDILHQIALTLTKHFDSVYYVEIKTGNYVELVSFSEFERIKIPKQGKDFFSESRNNASKCVHPNDLQFVMQIHDKAVMLEHLSHNDIYHVIYRMILNGKVVHMRHTEFMSEDKEHIICCLENVEEDFRKKEEQEKNLQSAERLARLDELTGIRNKNAFQEYSESINSKLKSEENFQFGIIMCDLNDLKHINDTRGHGVGDEAIQAASRMICNIFTHSPVFRIGGDEFIVILSGQDYDQRNQLLGRLREESIRNNHFRLGPVVASGLAIYEPDKDEDFSNVFSRADRNMYVNKNELKSMHLKEGFRNMDNLDKPITEERKRLLDAFFEALCTVASESYVYLNDMRYDFSRWSLPLITDFGMHSEYMYHAEKYWLEKIHPDDIEVYQEAIDVLLYGNVELRPIQYRARKTDGTYVILSTKGFILTDKNGEPEYFGGIIISK